MEDKSILTITNYVGIWGWQLIAILFLCSSLIIFSLQRTLITSSIYVGLFILFGIAEIISFRRRKEFENVQ